MSVVGWAVITAVAVACALGAAKPLGRWFLKAVKQTFTEVVNEAVEPRFQQLGQKMDDVQLSNASEHGATSARLGAVEQRLVDVESRLQAVENRLPKEAE